MNSKKITHWAIISFGYLAVLYPLWVRAHTLQFAFDMTLLPNVFPLFGLAAFSMLWLHAISGVFEEWLRQHINFDRFVQITATLILWCIILHPLLLLFMLRFNTSDLFLAYGTTYITLGIIGWLLLITYDITKPLKKHYQFFAKNWTTVLIISNIGFLITFFHATALGSDLQSGPLRGLWYFYGITATLAILYTYGVKRFIK